MTKPCVVPQCKTGSKSLKIKRSVFKVPSSSERLKKWQNAIPNRRLTSSHYVCEKHFEEHFILRKYIRLDSNGRVIAEVQYKHPRLTDAAIPTIFVSDVSPGHNFSNKSSPMDIQAETQLDVLPMDIPVAETGQNPLTNAADNADVTLQQVVAGTTFNVSPVVIFGNTPSAHLGDGVDCIQGLPAPWVVGQLSARPDQCLVFLYPQLIKKHETEIPITAKTVTVDGQKNLRYYVHGNLVDHDRANLQHKLDSLTDLPDILIKYQHMKLCGGIGKVNIHLLPIEESFQNYTDEWHHNDCSLLWKKRRCDNCCKLRECVLQKLKSIKSLRTSNRIRFSNSVEEQKIKIMRNLRRERLVKNRAKSRLSIVQSSLKTQHSRDHSK